MDMELLELLNAQGDFCLRNAQKYPGIYFPLANKGGMISSVTPMLAGDCKTGQNTYLLAPASSETLHESRASRNFWVKFKDGSPWSVAGQSAPQQAARFAPDGEESILTGGLLWQQVERTHRETGLTARTLSFVPAGEAKVEIMQVSLTNTGAEPLTLTPIAAIPMYGRSADNIRDHRHVTSLLHRVTLVPHGVDLRPTLTFDERGHKLGEVTYRVWGGDENGNPPTGFVPLVRDFVGQGSYDWLEGVCCPDSVKKMHAGQSAQGGEVVAALYFPEVTIEPGKELRYQIILAIDDDPAPYLTPAAVEAALAETKAYWQQVSAMAVSTGNPAFDPWMKWVGIQPTLRRICGCSFLPHHDYGRGGRGWRDLWQDSLALLLTEPGKTRSDLLSYFAGVRTDGTNATIIGARPGEFKADRNNIPRVWMDHGFWPLLTVELYLNETGDDLFLLEEQPYFRDTLAHRGEGKPLPQPGSPKSGTVWEHLLIQAVTAFFDVGEHGHMRLRGADWNDGLDMASQRGESVAFTAAYAGNFDTLADRAERLIEKGVTEVSLSKPLAALLEAPWGNYPEMVDSLMAYCLEMEGETAQASVPMAALADRLCAMADYMKAHIRQTEWVGDGADLHWFNSYYDNSGRQVEGVQGDVVRMMLTGQVFTLLSGTATQEQAEQIIRAADWYLCDPSCGGYRLNTDFREVKLDMGRMFGFSYGSKENGAVFCHMAVMYAYALYSRGFAEAGWKVLEYLFAQCTAFSQSKILPGVPEYFDERGQGMYPYLTGTGSWLLLTLQTQVFGVRGCNGDLLLEPKLLPDHFDENGEARITCFCAGHDLAVCYHNPLELEYGSYEIGTVVWEETEMLCSSDHVLIPREAIPQGKAVTLDVTLAPC